MSAKDKIISQYKKKISEIKKHNERYFLKDNPTISDADYDQLKKDLISLESKHTYLKKFSSIDKIFPSEFSTTPKGI